MKQKSTPNLKKKASTPAPEPPKSPPPANPQPRNRGPPSILIDKTRPRKRSTSESAPKPPKLPKPLRLPLSPGTPSNPRDVSGPRFMSMSQADTIKPTEYRPRPKRGPLKMPTIMGVTASRLLPPRPVEVKRESRPTRIMKALKDPYAYAMRMKWKGSAKEFLRMRMIKRLNGCMRALHEKPPVPIQEEDKPLQIEVRLTFSFV